MTTLLDYFAITWVTVVLKLNIICLVSWRDFATTTYSQKLISQTSEHFRIWTFEGIELLGATCMYNVPYGAPVGQIQFFSEKNTIWWDSWPIKSINIWSKVGVVGGKAFSHHFKRQRHIFEAGEVMWVERVLKKKKWGSHNFFLQSTYFSQLAFPKL